MSNILLSQPGGVGLLATDGAIQTAARCYLSATGGVTAASWSLTQVPTGSTATAKLHPSLGWYFDPDIRSPTPYIVQLTDTLASTHTNSFLASSRPVAPVYGQAPEPCQASGFGAKFDAVRLTDVITRGGSTVVSSVTANWQRSDVGKIFIMRAANKLAQGTISSVVGNDLVSIAGGNLPVDLPIVGGGAGGGQPAGGGAIYVPSLGYIVAAYSDGISLLLLAEVATATVNGKPWYTEVQLTGTIVRYISSTSVELSVAAVIDEAGATFDYGTDDTTAIDDTIQFAIANGLSVVQLPSGRAAITDKLTYAGASHLRICGASMNGTTLVDFRKCSKEYPYPQPDQSSGTFNFINCINVWFEELGYDGNVVVLQTVHSAGGIVNTSGARSGFVMIGCPDSGFRKVRSVGYGARDEHFYVGGNSYNFTFDSCDVVLNNNVSINVNAGLTARGLIVKNCRATGILIYCESYAILGNYVTANGINIGCGIAAVSIGHGIISGNTIFSTTRPTANAAISVSGFSSTNASLLISNNVLDSLTGPYYVTDSAIITVDSFGGIVTIVNNLFKSCTSTAPGGRYIGVWGVSTGTVVIGTNVFGPGPNMTVGVFADAAVPTGAVIVTGGSWFDSSITTVWDLGSAIDYPVDRVIQFGEISDPAAPPANRALFYAKDNGSGKTQIVVRFPTGAVQVIATEP